MKRADLLAGLSVAGLMLPEGVAYAGIAGLPPQRAIFAAIAGCIVYAAVGRSRFAIISPTSSSAAILAATLAVMPGSATVKIGLATVAVGLAGILFLLAAAARLGGLTGFISRPVLRGFAFGLAITIIIKQLPILVGVPVHAPDVFHSMWALIGRFSDWNFVSLAVGMVAVAGLLGLRRLPALPGALLVLAFGIVATIAFHLQAHGVATVGTIDMALAWPTLPAVNWVQTSRLAQYALPLVLILFAESWGTVRALALRHGDMVDANREIGALGCANLASAIVQGMPVGAGFSAGSASEAAGATSRLTGAFAAVGLAILMLCAGPAIALLPEPVLAAVVIAALTHALNPAPLLRLWHIGRDQYVAIAAAVGVLALGVLDGMLIAIALSLAALIQRLASTHAVQLGRLGASHDFVDIARHPDAASPAEIRIWRPVEPLFFANADTVLNYIATRVRADPTSRAVILSVEESFDLDSTALDALGEFDTLLSKSGVRLQLARVHDRVHDLILLAGSADLAARCSYSVDDAVAALTPKGSP
jgi:MFS superfamily sulfate permease-like transporter